MQIAAGRTYRTQSGFSAGPMYRPTFRSKEHAWVGNVVEDGPTGFLRQYEEAWDDGGKHGLDPTLNIVEELPGDELKPANIISALDAANEDLDEAAYPLDAPEWELELALGWIMTRDRAFVQRVFRQSGYAPRRFNIIVESRRTQGIPALELEMAWRYLRDALQTGHLAVAHASEDLRSEIQMKENWGRVELRDRGSAFALLGRSGAPFKDVTFKQEDVLRIWPTMEHPSAAAENENANHGKQASQKAKKGSPTDARKAWESEIKAVHEGTRPWRSQKIIEQEYTRDYRVSRPTIRAWMKGTRGRGRPSKKDGQSG